MFDPSSRYYSLQSATVPSVDADGKTRLLVYKKRRFIPSASELSLLTEHVVQQGDRIDGITARYLGDPTQYFRICDANGALRPSELTESVGRVLRIASTKL